MFEHLTNYEAARACTIQAAAQGISAYQLALACNRIRPGNDYRGMGKRALYDEYAKGSLSHISGQAMRDAIST